MTSHWQSHFDGVTADGWAAGWIYDEESSKSMEVDIFVDGQLIGSVTADQFRKDLLDAGLSNPQSAFWLRIPEDNFEYGEHEIAARTVEHGDDLLNSPQRAWLGRRRPARSAPFNLLPNSDFTDWPNGLSVKVSDRFQETARGWFVDHAIKPGVSVEVSLAHPTDAGLRASQYALSISVDNSPDGIRVIVPLATPPSANLECAFSCTLRRLRTDIEGELNCEEIFLGALSGAHLEKLQIVSKRLSPLGSVRLQNLPVVLQARALEGRGAQFVLVFELSGRGGLIISAPAIGEAVEAEFAESVEGDFEDPNIRDQIGMLKLPLFWSPDVLAVPAAGREAPVPQRLARHLSVAAGLPFVQIVIPVFNALEDVGELLGSILRHTASPFEVLIADDHSDAFTAGRLDAWLERDARIRLLRNAENLGYTRTVNLALHSAVADYVVVMNSDTVVSSGWLSKLIAVLLADENTAAVGPVSNAASWQSVPVTRHGNGDWAVNVLPSHVSIDEMSDLVEELSENAYPIFPLLNGFCTIFRRSALDATGYLDDESFPRGYGEENDLCIRLTRNGYRLRVADDVYVHHKKSRSFGHRQRKEQAALAYKILRNKYPEIDFDAIEDEMRNCAPLNELRKQLKFRLAEQQMSGAPASGEGDSPAAAAIGAA